MEAGKRPTPARAALTVEPLALASPAPAVSHAPPLSRPPRWSSWPGYVTLSFLQRTCAPLLLLALALALADSVANSVHHPLKLSSAPLPRALAYLSPLSMSSSSASTSSSSFSPSSALPSASSLSSPSFQFVYSSSSTRISRRLLFEKLGAPSDSLGNLSQPIPGTATSTTTTPLSLDANSLTPTSPPSQHFVTDQLLAPPSVPPSPPPTSSSSSRHKSIPPVTGLDVALFVAAFVFLFISTAAGVGGGVLLLPLLLVTGFTQTEASALSNVVVFATSLGSTAFNLFRTYPDSCFPIISWDLVLMFAPTFLFGSSGGSYLVMLIPSWVSAAVVVVMVVLVTWRSVQKAKVMCQTEISASRAKEQAREAASGAHEDGSGGVVVGDEQAPGDRLRAAPRGGVVGTSTENGGGSGVGSETGCSVRHLDCDAMSSDGAVMALGRQMGGAGLPPLCNGSLEGGPHWDEGQAQAAKKIVAEEDATVPLRHGLLLLSQLAVLVSTSVLARLLFPCGSWQYWLLIFIPVPMLVAIFVYTRWHILWKSGMKAQLNLQLPTTLNWTARNSLLYALLATAVGVLGALGIGGSVILMPLFLELRISPVAAAATTQLMLVTGSLAGSVVFGVSQAILWDYAVPLVIVALVATVAGQKTIDYVVYKYGRPSGIVVALAVLMLLATFASGAVLVSDIIGLVHQPSKLGAVTGTCHG